LRFALGTPNDRMWASLGLPETAQKSSDDPKRPPRLVSDLGAGAMTTLASRADPQTRFESMLNSSGVGSYVVMDKLPIASHSGRTEKAPVSNPTFEKQDVAKTPRPTTRQSQKVARMSLVSATVYLPPDKLALIKKICGDSNRRISDLISEAVDDYLRRRR
jgi:hypothetical protein